MDTDAMKYDKFMEYSTPDVEKWKNNTIYRDSRILNTVTGIPGKTCIYPGFLVKSFL